MLSPSEDPSHILVSRQRQHHPIKDGALHVEPSMPTIQTAARPPHIGDVSEDDHSTPELDNAVLSSDSEGDEASPRSPETSPIEFESACETRGVHIAKHLRFTSGEGSGSSFAVDETMTTKFTRRHFLTEPATPDTPSLSETAHQIRRTLSLAPLDALLVLHQDAEERHKFLNGVKNYGRNLVWRAQDEKSVYPNDAERAFVLAFKRGLRAFILGFNTRAGINVLLLLFRALRRRKLTLRNARQAIFGAESFRFGAMVGSFTFLSNFTLHLLRIAPSLSTFWRRVRTAAGILPFTPQPPGVEPKTNREHRWHAAAAGAVGSLGLLWETVGRRTGIAQQLFVRGLQGEYNQLAGYYGIHIPHGAAITFALCCGQLMYAYLLSPQTLPRGYLNWIRATSGVPIYAEKANYTAVRHNVIDPMIVERAMHERKGVTADHMMQLEQLAPKLRGGWNPRWHIPCAITHPWTSSCFYCVVERFFEVSRFVLPMYSALNIIPLLVFRQRALAKAPLSALTRTAVSIARSSAFLGFFVFLHQGQFCIRTKILDSTIPNWLRFIVQRKEMFWLFGVVNSISLFIEDPRRRTELAMYVLPRGLESAWSAARHRAWVPIVPFGESILGAAAMAMIMDTYKHQPSALSGFVRKLVYQIVGPV